MSKSTKDSKGSAKPPVAKLKTLDLTKEEAAKVKGGMVATIGGVGSATPQAKQLPP